MPTIPWNPCPSSSGIAAHDPLESLPIFPWNSHEKTKGKDRADNIAGLKKAALVERATAELDGQWLPAELSAFTTAEERAAYAERAERETVIDDIDDIDDDAFDDDDEE